MMRLISKILIPLVVAIMAGCGQSYDDAKKLNEQKQRQNQREDSLALKVGVMPTLDCLPLYVAKENGLFGQDSVDIRLKQFSSQIDCDAAISSGRVEGGITDLVRAQRMKSKGVALDYVAATNTYWQLISNRRARIRRIGQLKEKMIAMARFSATALLADYAADSARLRRDDVFKIQINDVGTRLQMLLNNEMDAMMLTEPQASRARLGNNPVLMDSRDKDIWLGVIAFRSKAIADKNRKRQLAAFIKGYNAACDSINKNGVKHYADIIKKYCKSDDKTIKAMPKMKFGHTGLPRQKDVNAAAKWLKQQ